MKAVITFRQDFWVLVGLLLCFWVTSAEDVVQVKKGVLYRGQIRSHDLRFIRIEIKLPDQHGTGIKEIPLSSIEWMDFDWRPEEQQILQGQSSEALTRWFQNYWHEYSYALGRLNVHIGEVGLAMAINLEKSDREKDWRLGLMVQEMIAEHDWHAGRQKLAHLSQLRLMMKLGRIDEVYAAAKKLTSTDLDPEILSSAEKMIADMELKKMRTFEKEYPQWRQDPETQKQHEMMIQELLRQYTRLSTLYGMNEGLSAECLWMMYQLHKEMNSLSQANGCLIDIEKLYPKSIYAQRAKLLLEKQPSQDP
jgi:hypothetical protein